MAFVEGGDVAEVLDSWITASSLRDLIQVRRNCLCRHAHVVLGEGAIVEVSALVYAPARVTSVFWCSGRTVGRPNRPRSPRRPFESAMAPRE